jgi:hypothetical protein
MREHVNKNFISSITGKHLLKETDKRSVLKKEKEAAEILRLQQVKLQEESNKQRFIAAHYEKLRTPYVPVLNKEFAKSLNESLTRHFSRLPKHLHEQVATPSDWVPHNTPVGLFYVNQITGEWMNSFGHVALSLEDLLHATGEDMNSDVSQRFILSDIIPDTILPEPTSALDYAVWATTFYDISQLPGWNTEAYETLAVVPSVGIKGSFKTVGITNGSDVDYASFKSGIETIPKTRRVMGGYYFWKDIPFWTQDIRDYYKNKSDGVTYMSERFITPWTDVAFTENKQNLKSILNNFDTVYDVDFDYIHDDKETLVTVMDLVGQNYYEGSTAMAPLPGTTLNFFGGFMPDARVIPALIQDSRFNTNVNPNTGKTLATSIVDYYKTFSSNPGYTGTAEILLSKWAGITMQGDFCWAGESKRGYFSLIYTPLFRDAIPTPYYNAAHILDEGHMRSAFRGSMIEWVYGYYGTRYFTEAIAETPRYSNVKYANYESYTVNSTEAEFYRDSNDERYFSPTFPNKIGGKGWYGNSGNIISAYWMDQAYFSGYVTNPTTDKERYRWCGYGEVTYSGPGTLVRYGDKEPRSPFNWELYKAWSREIAHKQLIDDLRNLRFMHRSDSNLWNTHTPYVVANNLEFTVYYAVAYNSDGTWNKRFWNEFLYHQILHGVLFVHLFNGSDVSSSRYALQDALDAWRTISNDSRSRPCSNATGDINLPVDRLLVGDSVVNFVRSGGKLLKSNKYLWRFTASHAHVRANNTIVFQRVGSDSDIPAQVIVDCSDQMNGYGMWIKRLVSTPPQYVTVPE